MPAKSPLQSGGLLVVKVGGSLFDLPGLSTKLRAWLDQHAAHPILLVPGGGAVADVIRTLDQQHDLGEEKAHWLALRAMQLNAYFLAALLPETPVLQDPTAWLADAKTGSVAALDALTFLRDNSDQVVLPHSWEATSDSIAVVIGRLLGAQELILLKSVDVVTGLSWEEAGQHGFVDTYFGAALGEDSLPVRTTNFRAWS
jgi:aspartokinase-like uncharacterized kinase